MAEKPYNPWQKMVIELAYASKALPVSQDFHELTSKEREEDRELIESVLGQEIDDEEWVNICKLELDDGVL